jgi:Phage tail tube, TTP, lambda-like
MATTAVLSQGSAFYVLDDTVTSPAVVRQIKQTKGITGLGGSRTVIETTNLDSTAKDKSPGLMDSGSISFDLVENPADLGHQLLESLANTGTKPSKQWYFGLSDGTATAPSFSGTIAGGNLVLKTPPGSGTNSRTGYLFTGFIKQYSRDVAANGVVMVKGGIEITGPVFTAINGAVWTA